MIRAVWRLLWAVLVPGAGWTVAYWAAWLTGGSLAGDSSWNLAVYAVMLVLNAYSLFYQIRNKGEKDDLGV
jgi:hypothetical protein